MRKLLIVLMAVAALPACPKGPLAPPPEQMIVDPDTARNVTGEYAHEQLEEYYAERAHIFDEARRRIQEGENPEHVGRELMERLVESQESLDSALKHIPDIGDVNTPKMFERDRGTMRDILESASGS